MEILLVDGIQLVSTNRPSIAVTQQVSRQQLTTSTCAMGVAQRLLRVGVNLQVPTALAKTTKIHAPSESHAAIFKPGCSTQSEFYR